MPAGGLSGAAGSPGGPGGPVALGLGPEGNELGISQLADLGRIHRELLGVVMITLSFLRWAADSAE